MDSLTIATLLTVAAGLSTCIGGLIAITTKPTGTRFLSLAMGFAAGAMIYVSLVEILPKAGTSLGGIVGGDWGQRLAVLGFFIGIGVTALIDKLVPHEENPHEFAASKGREVAVHWGAENTIHPHRHKLMRMGLYAALAISVHNVPEGLATFVATLQDPTLGVAIATAIAVHNIPEGIAVAVPIYFATGSRRTAFGYAALSGLAEPVGAILGYALILHWFNDVVFGCTFAAVAGVMVFISFDQLLPAAEEYGEHHLSVYGLVAGLAIMAISLLLV